MTELLGRPPGQVSALLLARPGSVLEEGEALARDPQGREVRSPVNGLLLSLSASDGSVLLAPLGEEEPVIGHVHGRVHSVEPGSIVLEVPGVVLRGVGGTGEAVHGELVVAVHTPEEELRAGAIDVGATGRIVVGGSRASAETLTRARAMGVAGIVLGGVLDKELRDFEAIQRRRREIGGLAGSFGVLLLEGFGKVGIDPQRFAWLRAHAGRTASLFGAEGLLFVHEAGSTRPQAAAARRGAGHRPPAALPGAGGRAGGGARRPARHAIGHSHPDGPGALRGRTAGAGADGQPGGNRAGACPPRLTALSSLQAWTAPPQRPPLRGA